MYRILLLLFFLVYQTLSGLSQFCTPPSADNCENAHVLCSLDELNGFTCQNVDYSNPTACLGSGTSCPNGVPHNSSWWAFVTDGGFVSVTVAISGCVNGQGLQIGVVGACDCSQQISCNSSCVPSGNTITLSGNLTPCKTYYLWVDGCNADVCYFTLSTSGGTSPKLANFTLSRNGTNPICKGCCDDFKVTPQPGACEPEYVWTVDGEKFYWGPEEIVSICFPDDGTFSVCVQAVIGNPLSESICDEKTKCMNVTVTRKKDEIAKPRIYCPEKLPVLWHCQSISGPGEYRCPFKFNGCCEFDSVITIYEVNIQSGPEIWYVGCQGQYYRDSTTGVAYGTCLKREEILLRGKSKPYGCDSSYFLNTFFPSFVPNWNVHCDSGCVIIEANIKQIADECGHTPTYSYQYEWYKKGGATFSTSERICVDSAAEYCFRIKVLTTLKTASQECSFNYCERIDENSFLGIQSIEGPENPDHGKISSYYFTPSQFNIKKLEWRIEGGTLVDSLITDPKNLIYVKWINGSDSIGKVCLKISTDCYETKEYCKNIKFKANTSTSDQELQSNFNLFENPNQGTFTIQYNEDTEIQKIKIYNSNGKTVNFTQNSIKSAERIISLQEKTSGLYYIHIVTSRGRIYKKLIVVK
ncbi:MAG: T9SS type A sorting domain-containing protein [Saprospiraceae bacterium]